jgi:hypothetical protein
MLYGIGFLVLMGVLFYQDFINTPDKTVVVLQALLFVGAVIFFIVKTHLEEKDQAIRK